MAATVTELNQDIAKLLKQTEDLTENVRVFRFAPTRTGETSNRSAFLITRRYPHLESSSSSMS